jgi:hypothetical protein
MRWSLSSNLSSAIEINPMAIMNSERVGKALDFLEDTIPVVSAVGIEPTT